MMNDQQAFHAFQEYVSHYDQSDPAIHLKIVHTYAVVAIMDELTAAMQLTPAQCALARVIALLHDIGRFEQWRRYHTYVDHLSIDHAVFSCQLLFEEGLIREFIEPGYDDLIETAIRQHNRYRIDAVDEACALYVHLIRDADKLDNFRVKEVESIETMLGISLEELERETITPVVYEQFASCQSIYAPSRQTHLDMWLSWIAFIFDLHFDYSRQYVRDHDLLKRPFTRVIPRDSKTLEQYRTLEKIAGDYINEQ